METLGWVNAVFIKNFLHVSKLSYLPLTCVWNLNQEELYTVRGGWIHIWWTIASPSSVLPRESNLVSTSCALGGHNLLSHPPAFTNLFGVGLHGWLEIHNAALVLGSRIFITTANHHRDDIFGADASSTQLWNHLQIVEEISFLTHETFLINFFHFVFQYSPPCVTILCLRSDTSGRQSCKNNKKSVENEIRKTISEYWKRFLSPSVSFRA